MENRFGLKDLLHLSLLVLILVSIWLAMKQFDRQWDVVQSIDERLNEQVGRAAAVDRQLRNLESQLESMAKRPAVAPELLEQLAEVRTLIAGLSRGQVDMQALQDQLEQMRAEMDRAAQPATTPIPPDAEYFDRLQVAREHPEFAYGDWFIDSFNNTVGRLTPIVQTDAYQSAIEGYVIESLIRRDPETLEWRPWIAHQWQVADDGLSISYDLRPDVTFSDGRSLTSADVVYSYELIMNPDINAAALRSYYENIVAVDADGPHRVIFRLDEPYFRSLDFTGGMPILAKHFYDQFTPEQFNEMPGLLFGSGPYRLEENPRRWQPGTGQVALVRNENYWGPRASFDKLIFREIPDETAELVAFRNGEIDRYGVSPERYKQLSEDEDLLAKADLHVYAYPNAGYRYLGWNQKRNGEPTFFADRRVRRAMTLLTNRQEMAQQLMAGLATVATGPFNPLGQQADERINPIAYDPDKARRLLAEAGFEDRDSNGVLENADGAEFRFKLIYPSGNENYRQMAFYLKDAYARAGIVMEPDPTEWNTMLQRIDERNFDAITLGWTGNVEGDPKQIFHSESMAAGGSNYISYANPQLDELIDKARQTLDETRRREMWHRVHHILHEDQPYTFLFFSKAVVYMDKRIRNVLITRTGMNDRTEMFVPRALQEHRD